MAQTYCEATLTTLSAYRNVQVGDTVYFDIIIKNKSTTTSRTFKLKFEGQAGISTPADTTIKVLKNSSGIKRVSATATSANPGRGWLAVYVYYPQSAANYDDLATDYVNISDVVKVNKPTLTYNVKEYSSSGQEIDKADFSEFNNSAYYLSNNTGTTPGAYTCTLTCNTGYAFTDDTTSASYGWYIHKTGITKPTQIKSSTNYTGGQQSPDSSWFSNWSSWCTLNVTPQTNHSDTAYSGTITLYNEYCYWADNTQTPITFNWIINKISQSLSFNPSSASIVIGDSTTAALVGSAFGSYGQPTGQSHTSASYNMGTLTVTGVSVGTDTLKVYYQGDTNHYGAYVTFTATVTNPQPVQWSKFYVYKNGWKTAVPYVYHNGSWQKAQLYVYKSGWKQLNN